ncbi:MAG TPA: MFS transporter, partial [Euzebyales bacterium]|nr:MFS transporter [Euzebyales bacterium]
MASYGAARPLAALAALSVGAFAYVTAEALPIGLLLHIAGDLGVSTSAAGLLVTCYGAVVVLASIPLTVLTRHVPRRLLLSVVLAVFVVATVLSAVATSYGLVLAARMVGALSQAQYWAVVVPTAAGLFAPRVRGRVVAVVFAGGTAAIVLGVPAGTWLGDVAGWRMAFLALGAVGAATLAAVALLMPPAPAGQGHAAQGAAPDAARYGVLILVAALASAGAFTAYTYVAPFLTDVSGFPPSAISPILLGRGAASMVGVVISGIVVDRRPRLAMTVPVALQAVALIGLFALGDHAIAAIGLLAFAGMALAALTSALGSRVLELAPGRSDLASAGASTAFNVGITTGALVGGLLLPGFGVRGTVLVGGL